MRSVSVREIWEWKK